MGFLSKFGLLWKQLIAPGINDVKPGASFEATVCAYLDAVFYKSDVNIFSNVYIPYRGGTAEIDIIVLLPRKILVVECKDYKGTIYCNHDKYRDWIQCFSRNKSYHFYSPVKQNKTHIAAVCQALGVTPEQCVSAVVFSDTAVLKKIPKITGQSIVCNLRVLTEWLSRVDYNGQQLSVKRMSTILQGYAISDSVLREQHIEHVKERHRM